MAKVKEACGLDTNLPLEILLHRLNPVLRGWANHFRFGCSKSTFGYLRIYLWQEVIRWEDRKHPRTSWRQLRRQYSNGNGWAAVGNVVLFNPETVRTERYRYRGTKIPGPWAEAV
jgi:RNA-directed DNA polymerase